MCDIKKYQDIYQEIKDLDPDDTLQLIAEARDKDEQRFFVLIGDYLLQKNQREAIKENRF